MKAYFGISADGSLLSFDWYCPECHCKMISHQGTAWHPKTFKTFGIIHTKEWPLNCPHAGKRFRLPTIELEEIKS